MTAAERVFEIERPDDRLWRYYILASFVAGPFFPFALLPLYFRFRTLRYRFDEEGISMGWGILFRREIHLTYARIQDIHLVSNVVERWLGLARIQVQTASGSAKAEMTLEGILEYELVRDFLYWRMRGLRDLGRAAARQVPAAFVPTDAARPPVAAGVPADSAPASLDAWPADAPPLQARGDDVNGAGASAAHASRMEPGIAGEDTLASRVEPGVAADEDLAATLREVAAELRSLRLALESVRERRQDGAGD